MKRAIVIFALVSTVAGVASAQMLRSPSEASAPASMPVSMPASAPVMAKAEVPLPPKQEQAKQEQARIISTLVARQAPVPMQVRSRAPFMPPVVPAVGAAEPAPETVSRGLTEAAVRTAIEADGYKKVRVVSRATDGTWRAQALRGATEVTLRVDSQGNVIGD